MMRMDGLFAGQAMFVLANGPSLRNVNLAKLPRERTLGVNRIHWPPISYDPAYLVVVDLDAWKEIRPYVEKASCVLLVGSDHTRRGLYDQVWPELPRRRSHCFIYKRPEHGPTTGIRGGLSSYIAAQIAARMAAPGGKVYLCGMDLSYSKDGPTHAYKGRGKGCTDRAFASAVPDFVALKASYEGKVEFFVVGSSRLSDHEFTTVSPDDVHRISTICG